MFTKAPATKGEPVNLRCPHCGRDDAVQKVSAIHAAGIQTTNSMTTGLIAGGISSPYGGTEGLLASNMSSTRGSAQSGISVKLAPPPQPRRESAAGSLVLGFVFGALIGIFLAVEFARSSGFFVAAIAFAFIFGLACGLAAYGHSATGNLAAFENRMTLWNLKLEQWKKLYYCARDDVIFEPGSEKAAPADKMALAIDEMSGQA